MPLAQRALAFHEAVPAGKLGVAMTKPCETQEDLSLAYSPGVAAPCLAIHDDPALVYRYTGRSNLVALRARLSIPVFHDDQHGADASAMACADHPVRLGLDPAHVLMCDSHGLIVEGRTVGMNPYKARFARHSEARTVADALHGADLFLGLSAGNSVPAETLLAMAYNPTVFVLANPDPDSVPGREASAP